MIFLFTDFGTHGPYLGQLRTVLAQAAPAVPVIDLVNDAPAFQPLAAGHLLAALVPGLPPASVVVGVVDPGVGSARLPVAMQADGRWYVGPDNGLFEVAAARAETASWHAIAWCPPRLSASFHGRDLFAPVAARLATGLLEAEVLQPLPERFGNGADLAEVIYCDGYGNAMTGLRAKALDRCAALHIGEQRIGHAATFCEAAPGAALWYRNSLGLVEIAINRGDAAKLLGLAIGSPFTVVSPCNPGC